MVETRMKKITLSNLPDYVEDIRLVTSEYERKNFMVVFVVNGKKIEIHPKRNGPDLERTFTDVIIKELRKQSVKVDIQY